MAAITSLRMAFKTDTTKKLFITMDHVKGSVTGAEIAEYMQGLIDRAGFFVTAPTEMIGAELISRADVTLA